MVGMRIEVINVGKNKEITVLKVEGYIDSTTAPEIKKNIDDLIETQSYKIIVDLAGVEYISITGWDVFFFRLKKIRDLGGDIVISRMVADIQNIYELMELPLVIESFKSMKNAAAFLLGQKIDEKKEKAGKRKSEGKKAEAKQTAKEAKTPTAERDTPEIEVEKPAYDSKKIFDITNAEILPLLPKDEEKKG
ncbi:MAG TPA: anti-sigma factor antagonist [Spirochaetes bacterium]|nr:anti-sigma factor antagonist [Spirochaetota bacterium]